MLERIQELMAEMENELALLAVDPEERKRLQAKYDRLADQEAILLAAID